MKYKYELSCPGCRHRYSKREAVTLLISDEKNSYIVKCKQGHKNSIVYVDEKYNMLFASAMECIKEGHLREAIANLAASYERLLEYVIKIISKYRRIPENIVEGFWKQVANQSERQLGAFCFLYTSVFSENAPVLNSNTINIRNKVVHKGIYPTFNDVELFAKEVFKIMVDILFTINQKCRKIVDRHEKNMRLELLNSKSDNEYLSIIRIASFLDVDYANGKPSNTSLINHIRRCKKEFINVAD